MMIRGRTTVYHRTSAPVIVSSQAEYDALGEGWADTPAAFAEPVVAPPPTPSPSALLSSPGPGGVGGRRRSLTRRGGA